MHMTMFTQKKFKTCKLVFYRLQTLNGFKQSQSNDTHSWFKTFPLDYPFTYCQSYSYVAWIHIRVLDWLIWIMLHFGFPIQAPWQPLPRWQGSLILTWITFNPAWITCTVKRWIQLLIHSQTSTMPPLKFGDGWIISSHIYNGCNYLSMLGLKLINASKRRLKVMF